MSKEFEFAMLDLTSMVVEVDSDGSIIQAVKYDRGLCTDINVTEFVKNSTYWKEKIADWFAFSKFERDEMAEYKIAEGR